MYDIIVASDEKALEQPGQIPKGSQLSGKRRKDKESGVSRGIDFQFVSNVINFDFPLDVQSYIHRAGRTARGNNQGSVLSFISLREQELMMKVEKHLREAQREESVFKYEKFERFGDYV